MPEREFLEWQAYYRIEPFGEERADLRAGVVAATVANTSGTVKRGQRPYKASDFVLKFGEQSAAAVDDEADDPEAAIDQRRKVTRATREMFEARLGAKGGEDGAAVAPGRRGSGQPHARPTRPGGG